MLSGKSVSQKLVKFGSVCEESMKTNCRFLIVHGLSISWLSSLSFAASSIKKNKNKIKKTTAKWNQTLLKREIGEESEQTPLAL